MQDDQNRAEVEYSLTRILADDKFACAPQMSAFLAYVVRETLAGRAERLKAYTIGIEALGKPESFDSQTDPSVRVLAKRLRTCLTAYHERHLDADPVIEIRPGSYRPHFLSGITRQGTLAQADSGTVMHGVAANEACSALATVHVSDAHRPGTPGAALTAVAAGTLVRAGTLRVTRHAHDESATAAEDYALSLEAIESDQALRIELQLMRCADGLVVHGLTSLVTPERNEQGIADGHLPAAAVVAVETFAAELARIDGALLRDHRSRRDLTPGSPPRNVERPLALDTFGRGATRHSRLADAA